MDELHYISRWLHYIFGITWIGHLYFFNFVNMNLQPTLDAETKKKVNPQLMPRALFLFRWGAMVTFITGLIMFYLLYIVPFVGVEGGHAELFKSDRGIWMSIGTLLGTIMWVNVWFIIWPAQKKIIKGVRGDAPAAAPEVAKLAMNASKINTYLSVPMLMGMMNGAHGFTVFGGGIVGVIVGIALGLGMVFVAYKLAPKIDVTKLG